MALVDGLGNLARFVLLPGQRHDTIGVPPLIEGVAFGALLGDRAFDADWLRAELDTRGAVAIIPPKANRKGHFDFDRHAYRWRHLIENFFAKLKEFRAIATRYDKTDTSFRASINLAAAIIDPPPLKWSVLRYGFEPEEDLKMASKKHRPEEAVAKLRQVDVLVSQGQSVAEAIRAIGVTEVTYYRWRREFGGLKSDQVKRLKQLEAENGRLRQAVADLTLDKQILAEAARGNF